MSEREDFYIGYQPRASNATALLMRRLTLVLLVIALLISLVFVLSQHPFAASYFEFGRARGFSGTIIERPLPMISIPRAGGNSASSYTLVGAGKHGAGGEVAGLEGRTVRLNGTIIHRDGMTMIEVAPGSVRPTDQVSGSVAESPEDLGAAEFTGEIVDSKCYLGVMNPGETKVHRECAVRCISGGVPPLLVARDETGARVHLWLVSLSGGALGGEILDRVAERVRVAGRLVRADGRLLLYTDPRGIRR